MDDDSDEAGFLAELLGAGQTEIRPDVLLEYHARTRETLCKSARVETAALFGALLLDPRLQSNCLRLEALVHLAVAAGHGSKLAPKAKLADCFNDLGVGICGQMEDPAEDVFVSNVTTREGDFRVLEGIWESGGFYLQRVVDIVERMPDVAHFAKLRSHVFALLRLSEAVCERRGLARYCVGATIPRRTITKDFCSAEIGAVLSFDRGDLARYGIAWKDLSLFVCEHQSLARVPTEIIANSPLQHFPIIAADDRLVLVLPSAVSFAIRNAVLAFVQANNLRVSMINALARHYAALFQRTPILGNVRDAPIMFRHTDDMPVAEILTGVDSGRYLHFVFFTDTLEHLCETGLAGPDPTPPQYVHEFRQLAVGAIEYASKQRDYRNGVTLLVHCGIGRGLVLPIPDVDRKDWEIHFISAADLYTLSFNEKFNAIALFRALEGVRRLADLGVNIQNHNGVLNLIAWIDSNEGHLVTHSQVPKGFRKSQGGLLIDASFVLGLRRNVAIGNDTHGVRTVDGNIEVVRRVGDSYFPEDNELPIYAALHFSKESGIPFVYLSKRRAWWCHVIPSADGQRDYDRWLMLRTWLARIVPAIEPRVGDDLVDEVLLRVEFQTSPRVNDSARVPERDEIKQSFSITLDPGRSTVTVSVGPQFGMGLFQPTNVSERVLVSAVCDGFMRLAGVMLTAAQLNELESAVVESDDARQLHSFQARAFRDFVREDLSQKPISLDDRDNADLRAGLAFRVESRHAGRSSLRSKKQCTDLLNAIVRNLADELCLDLKRFDRASLVELCLRNRESAIVDRERWTKTARANLALHRDRTSALEVIVTRYTALNSVIVPSTTLVEFAICESPLAGGLRPGHLDLSRLMAKANAIWILGGWSDAIYMDAMPPALLITPLGDVQAETGFESRVVMPFLRNACSELVDGEVAAYGGNFQPVRVTGSTELAFDEEFLDAWAQEFGFALSEARKFVDAIEDIGLDRKLAVFAVQRSEIEASLCERFMVDGADAIISALTLAPRAAWRTLPEGFDEKDIQPWRFRRRLAAVRRPLVQLNSGEDPTLMVAPGLVRESFKYVVEGYYEGSFPGSQYKAAAMQRWCGKRANIRGSEFTQHVARRAAELGWSTRTEVQLTEILGYGTDADFGDVSRFGDVDVLAWDCLGSRVLVFECKHLHFHKTFGEIAEQLSDYRGRRKRNGKPDDLLKHLNRLEVLAARRSTWCKRFGLRGDAQIEAWVVFRNAVPMLYSWSEFENRVHIATFDDIGKILNSP